MELDPDEVVVVQLAAHRHRQTLEEMENHCERTAGADPHGGDADPFGYWEEQFDPASPAVDRLLGDPHPDDPQANSDHHRRFDAELMLGFDEDLFRLDEDLDRLAEGPLKMTEERTERWIRTVAVMRVGLAADLGIVDEASRKALDELAESEGCSTLHYAYEWLGGFLEVLVEVSAR